MCGYNMAGAFPKSENAIFNVALLVSVFITKDNSDVPSPTQSFPIDLRRLTLLCYTRQVPDYGGKYAVTDSQQTSSDNYTASTYLSKHVQRVIIDTGTPS